MADSTRAAGLMGPLVLVADDDPAVCEFVAEVLETAGLRTMTTGDPEAVVTLATTHEPALLVTDILMPGLDGYTLATRLRGTPATEHLPIIFITGAPERIYRTLSFGVGGVAHLQKPFLPAQLLELVHQVVPPVAPTPPATDSRPRADGGLRCVSCQSPLRVEKAMVTEAGVAHRRCPQPEARADAAEWRGTKN